VTIANDVLEALVVQYTRESGVRNLQRELEALLRDTAMTLAEGSLPKATLGLEDLARVLGPARYHDELVDKAPAIGVVCGLGWTPVGGRLLFVEAATTPGDGNVRLTGRLGDVMRESAETALSLVRSRASRYGIDPLFMRTCDVHVHVPDGAVPKDGPSAGITVTTAIVSTLTRRPVRTDIAMTDRRRAREGPRGPSRRHPRGDPPLAQPQGRARHPRRRARRHDAALRLEHRRGPRHRPARRGPGAGRRRVAPRPRVEFVPYTTQ
jgi:hypothetical protein